MAHNELWVCNISPWPSSLSPCPALTTLIEDLKPIIYGCYTGRADVLYLVFLGPYGAQMAARYDAAPSPFDGGRLFACIAGLAEDVLVGPDQLSARLPTAYRVYRPEAFLPTFHTAINAAVATQAARAASVRAPLYLAPPPVHVAGARPTAYTPSTSSSASVAPLAPSSSSLVARRSAALPRSPAPRSPKKSTLPRSPAPRSPKKSTLPRSPAPRSPKKSPLPRSPAPRSPTKSKRPPAPPPPLPFIAQQQQQQQQQASVAQPAPAPSIPPPAPPAASPEPSQSHGLQGPRIPLMWGPSLFDSGQTRVNRFMRSSGSQTYAALAPLEVQGHSWPGEWEGVVHRREAEPAEAYHLTVSLRRLLPDRHDGGFGEKGVRMLVRAVVGNQFSTCVEPFLSPEEDGRGFRLDIRFIRLRDFDAYKASYAGDLAGVVRRWGVVE